MGSVEQEPLHVWSVVQLRLSGKREIIGSFTDYDVARHALYEVMGNPRRFTDDIYGYELIRLVEEPGYLEGNDDVL